MKTKMYTANFSIAEMACKCSYPDCSKDDHIMDQWFMLKLQKLRELVAEPLVINSAFRCEAHNEDVGGSVNSFHKLGRAADIRMPEGLSGGSKAKHRARLVEYAMKAGLYGIGLDGDFIHLDNRGYGQARIWLY